MRKIKYLLVMGLVAFGLVGCAKKVSTDVNETYEVTKESGIDDIREHISKMYETGANVRLHVENNSWYLMYNSSKDCYAEISKDKAAIYRPNGTVTIFSDKVTKTNDLDPLIIISNALDCVGEGKADFVNLPGDDKNAYVITVNGRKNIKELYGKTLSSGDTTKFTDRLFEEIRNSADLKDTELAYRIKLSTQGEDSMSASLDIKVGEETYAGWEFTGYVSVGDWQLPINWGKDGASESDWANMYKELTTELNTLLDNYKETELPQESTEASSVQEISTDVDTESLSDSFRTEMVALLERDNLSDIDLREYDVPKDYTETDKEKMISLYESVRDWSGKPENGVLVYPIDMDDIEFIRDYIGACKEAYKNDLKSSETDTYGTIFWEDTLGSFIKLMGE